MKAKRSLMICVTLTIILTSCGKQTELSEQEVSETTETVKSVVNVGQSELSELEKQIEEFENGTSDEITVTQDILRGEWRIGGKDEFENGGYTPETIELGNLELDYATDSKNSKVIFTNNEFMISYDEPEVKYGKGSVRYSKIVNNIIVSGIYRVTSEANYNEESDMYESEIEMLVTSVSPKYGIMNKEIYNELNSLVGMVVNKKVTFLTFYEDWSNVSAEQLEEYDIDVHEEVAIELGGEITMSGFIYYDTPILSKGNPMTWVYLSESDDDVIITELARTKMKNTVSTKKDEKIEDGVWLYDVTPHEEIETTE